MLVFTLIAALTAQAPMPTGGATATQLRAREARLNLDGRNWACDVSGQCNGRGSGNTQPLIRKCRRFTARVGAVSSYARGGLALTTAEIAQCNAGVAS